MRESLIVTPRQRKIRKRLTVLAFLSLWLIGFSVLFVYAIGQTLVYSFTNFNFMNKMKWVGLGNYIYLIVSDSVFWESLGNTGFILLIVVPVILLLSFLLAVLVKNKSGVGAFASIAYFLPFVIPLAATGLVWRWMFNGHYGIVNYLLQLFSIPGQDWLLDSALVKPAISIAESTLIGQYFIIFVAALQEVPVEFYEAAEIDGASGFRRLWNITLPMISPAFYFNLVTCFIGEFQIFDMPWVMTLATGGQNISAGGPGYSSTTFSIYMYIKMFQQYDAGTASAMAMISLILVLGVSFLMVRASKRLVTYER